MSVTDLLSFGLPVSGEPELSHPRPERLLRGNSRRVTKLFVIIK